MRLLDHPSWRFVHDVGEQDLHAVLYVRDALRLPKSTPRGEDASAPPPLVAGVPAYAALVAPADRAAVQERWNAWFAAVAVQVGTHQMAQQPVDGDRLEWLRALQAQRQRLMDAPEWTTLADCPPLRTAVQALWDDAVRWVEPVREPYQQKPLREQAFPWALVRDRAQHAAAVHHVSEGEVDGVAEVLLVQGVWWRLVAPGIAVCSVDAAADPAASTALLDAVFDSHLAG